MAVPRLVRDMGERGAHVAIDGVGRQERLGVHRVEVVDAIAQRGLEAPGAQGARDDVEDHGAAEAPDMDGPRRGLGVVDDLGALDARRQLVGPVHGVLPLSWAAVVPPS